MVGIVALATVAMALWGLRDTIRFRWYLFQVRETIADARAQMLSWEDSFKPAEYLSGPLKELDSDGELGFRAIATLLEDDDPRVWTRTAELPPSAGSNQVGDAREAFLEIGVGQRE